MLHRLMVEESTYYESLASAHYVEEAKKRNRTGRLQEAKRPRTGIMYRWAETKLLNRK